MEVIPEGNSLEGFLPSAVYSLERDITAEELIRLMLDQWETTVGDVYIQQAEEADKDFYEVLTMASIVEREVGVPDEAPQVAGVYQNRLDGEADGVRLLNADPTVIYANDGMELDDLGFSGWPEYSFWGLIGEDLASFEVPAELQSFQSYQNVGLPEWPIATPSIASIEAALEPDTESGYLYFVACGDEGEHRFAETLREHNANVQECQS